LILAHRSAEGYLPLRLRFKSQTKINAVTLAKETSVAISWKDKVQNPALCGHATSQSQNRVNRDTEKDAHRRTEAQIAKVKRPANEQQ
jgi:hypothetical protein